MRRIYLFVLALPTLLVACGSGTTLDALRSGMPTSDTVQMKLPNQSGQALEDVGQQQQALEGQLSGFYLITRFATLWVNGGTILVLGLVKAITDNPPTSFKGNVAVWGPYTDPLGRNTYRLTATDNGNNHYSYVVEGKAKQDPDSAYVAILSGAHVPATDSHGHPMPGFGSGTFLIDWDKAHTLPEHDPNSVGTAAFSYSRLSASAQIEIDVTFTQVLDLQTQPPQRIDANYRYVSVPGGDGLFQFSTYRLNNGGTIERLAIESRWKNNGAGRSDVLVRSPALSVPATVNECWDQNFISRYQRVSYDPSQNYGDEGRNCVFAPAEYSPL